MARIVKTRRQRLILGGAVLVTALSFLVYGGWGLWQYHTATHTPPRVIANKIITHSTDTPSEAKPTDACAIYVATNGQPERINIPSAGVNGCIEQVGIDQYGAIAVPSNIYMAGWYVKSALPGQKGLSVIDGHISGRYKEDAIFQHLQKLKTGATFTVKLGGGKDLRYEVRTVRTVQLKDSADVLLAKDPNITSQLNLITCAGKYDQSTKIYDHRVIVSAALIEPTVY